MTSRSNSMEVPEAKAANGTMSENDRSYIQNEVDQLVTEIDRVSETTKFNETYLLKGDTNGVKKTDFQYKEAEVTSEDLYYLDKDGKVRTLSKGTYKEAVDSTPKYFKSEEGDKVGAAIDTAEEATYFGTDKVKLIGADNLYKKSGDDYVLVKKGDEYSGTAGDYYTITFNDDGTVATAAALAAEPTTTQGWKLAKDVYDKTGDLVLAGTVIADADKANYYKAISTAKFDSDKAVTPEYVKSSVQFTDKDGNEIAANGLYQYIDDGVLKSVLNCTKCGTLCGYLLDSFFNSLNCIQCICIICTINL